VYATHLSKPIITNFSISEDRVLSIIGTTDYFAPTSDIILYLIIKNDDGSLLKWYSTISDNKGYFNFKLELPANVPTNNYIIEIMSQCRIEHQSICANSSINFPFEYTSSIYQMYPLNDKLFNETSVINDELNKSIFENENCKNMNKPVEPIANSIIVGTENDDVIVGTNRDDIIYANGGDDIICSGMGNDIIYAGLGSDIVYSGNGTNYVYGSYGNDIIYSDRGSDIVYGSYGNDIIYSGMGYDQVEGNGGLNFCFGYAKMSNCYN
jgi:Ca2+-binding RTX toxin-like protein